MPVNRGAEPQVIKFDYIKTNSFRTIRADGIWGGVNGHLDIIMAFYSERPAIPQQTVFPIEDGHLGNELEDRRVGRDAVIRDVEVCVSMNVEVAKLFREWLDEKIRAVGNIQSKAKPKRKKK